MAYILAMREPLLLAGLNWDCRPMIFMQSLPNSGQRIDIGSFQESSGLPVHARKHVGTQERP